LVNTKLFNLDYIGWMVMRGVTSFATTVQYQSAKPKSLQTRPEQALMS